MASNHRPTGSKKGRSKTRCPACGSRNASVVESSGTETQKAGCLQCGHFFTVGSRENTTSEKGFGKSRPNAAFRDTWVIRFFLLIAVAVVIALGVGIRIGISQKKDDKIASKVHSTPRDETRPIPDADTQAAVQAEVAAAEKSITTKDKAMRDALGKFLGASSWTERLEFVRHPEITGKRMAQYYKDHEDGAFDNLVISTRITRVGSLVVFTLEGKKLPSNRLILEERGRNYLADWEAFVLWQELPWTELPTMPADQTCEIRCLARPLPNNHPAYRSEDGWESFELLHPGTQEILYGFLKVQEGTGEKDPITVLQNGALGPVTLTVTRMPKGGDGEQVLITKVLALGWIYPPPEK